MRTLLNLAHCHGAVLGTSWQLVLATLQHLVWILGLKPSSGGALKPGRAVEGPSTVLTTAVMTDLPVISIYFQDCLKVHSILMTYHCTI